MSYGISIAEEHLGDGKTPLYDSSNNRLQVDATPQPKHMDVFVRSGGTSWTPPDLVVYSEDLLTIKHGYSFIPGFLIYFTLLDAPVAYAAKIGKYEYGNFSISGVPDNIFGRSDATNFYITHETTGFEFTDEFGVVHSFSSEAAQFSFRIKYMILNIPSSGEAYIGF